MAPPNIKNMIQIKIKPRQDSYSDQFSRILMVKMMMMTAGITAISWMKDKLSCIIPKGHGATKDFVSKSCWINGLYIYEGMDRKHQSYYYGIPKAIDMTGLNKFGDLCNPSMKNCVPMEKTFYLQYQWFPLGVAALGFLYYLPYLCFRAVNTDMQIVKEMVKGKKVEEVDYEDVIQKFFNRKYNTRSLQNARILLNIIVKILYVVVNVSGLLILDSALNGVYLSYGKSWTSWAEQEHEDMHDYTDRVVAKAGNVLLPTFGLCEVQSSAKDKVTGHMNYQTYMCELSQHVLYQYILIVLWYVLVFGIIVSILGLLYHIFKQISLQLFNIKNGEAVKEVYRNLSPREREYMEFIRRKNRPVFGEILHRLSDGNYSDKRASSSYDSSQEM